jgi:DNA-binding transcriptional LysR family regulator
MDLHLLPHFDALIRTVNVSRAAEVVGITQPAMSGALGRLRELLGDPILIRSGQKMVATQRALELHRTLAPLLEQWLDAIEPPSFAPDTSTRTFSLVASDYMQFLLLPKLARALERNAPRARLRVLPTNPVKTLEMLETGHAEFVIGHVENPPGSLRSRSLHAEVAVCLLRRDHAALSEDWNLQTYARLRHIQVTSSAYRNFSDALTRTLSSLDVNLDLGITVSSYLATPHIVAGSDLVATLPQSIAVEFARALPVAVVSLPVEMPVISISLLWHERHQKDLAHRWLRELIASTLAPPAAPPGRHRSA